MDNSIRNYYEDNPKGGKSSDPQATMRFDLLEKEVNKYKPKKILDVGCGKGHLAQRLAKYSQTYVGVDFSQKAIQLAQATVPQAEFVVADATKLPFADDEFDLVICTEVLNISLTIKNA